MMKSKKNLTKEEEALYSSVAAVAEKIDPRALKALQAQMRQKETQTLNKQVAYR